MATGTVAQERHTGSQSPARRWSLERRSRAAARVDQRRFEGAAGASEEESGQRRKTADRERERANPGWSRGQQGKYH
ncbi:unnamed protein product, partial [Staurois parvus]